MKKPDWRKPEDYAFTDKLTLAQLAWEFLRRNPKYIRAWGGDMGGLTAYRENPSIPIPDEPFVAELWGLRSGSLDPDISYDDKDIKFIPLVHPGLLMLIPKKPIKRSISDKPVKGFRIVGQLPDHSTGSCLIEFNFHQPIKPQIDEAKQLLLQLQRESKKRGIKIRVAFKPRRHKKIGGASSDEWALLLRILDATTSEAKDKEIANVLFPIEDRKADDKKAHSAKVSEAIKKVHDKRKQAMRYAERSASLRWSSCPRGASICEKNGMNGRMES